MSEQKPLTILDLSDMVHEMAGSAPQDTEKKQLVEKAAELLLRAANIDQGDDDMEPAKLVDVEYSFDYGMQIAKLWRSGKLIGGDQMSVIFALLNEIEKRSTGAEKGTERDAEGDLLVNLGDMTGFNLDSLKKIMSGGVDNNHEAMVEEHIKVFNYAITQGIHPGQALLACVQAIGSLLGFAIRSGMHPNTASAMTALLIKTTQDAATQVQIVTTN